MKFTRSRRRALAALLLIQAFSLPTFAALGGNLSSIEDDQLKMKGTLRTTAAERYTVQEIQTSQGTLVREYVAPSGVVFAVAWRGPKMPDLRQALGAYFTQFTDAPRPAHPNHAHFAINQPNLVLQSSAHMRAYSGRAYDPQLLPVDVPVTDIQ
ncbi:MAG TPA: DUF2844 domain-containing protein [Steroidobacteraceae bacterium]